MQEKKKSARPAYFKIEVSVIDYVPKLSWKDLTKLVLSDPDVTCQFPYQDFFKKSFKSQERETVSRLVYRGDSRFSPEEILEAGGIHPNATITEEAKLPKNKISQRWEERGAWMLDAKRHVTEDSQGSGLVSTTPLKKSACFFTGSTGLTNNPHLYILRAQGAIANKYSLAGECEYSIPGGFDSNDIIAFRGLSKKKIAIDDTQSYNFFNGAPLYVQIEFAEKHPTLVTTLVHAMVDEHEKITKTPRKIRELLRDHPSHFTPTNFWVENQKKASPSHRINIDELFGLTSEKSLDELAMIKAAPKLYMQFNLFKPEKPIEPSDNKKYFLKETQSLPIPSHI